MQEEPHDTKADDTPVGHEDPMDLGTPDRPTHDEWKYITDRRVTSRRVSIGEDVADRHGFSIGDPVDLVLYPVDGRPVPLTSVRIGTQHRVTIPLLQYENHELGGATVDLHIRHTPGPDEKAGEATYGDEEADEEGDDDVEE